MNKINENIIEYSLELFKKIIKWIVLSIIMGIMVGIFVGFLKIILNKANNFRGEHNYLIYFLPIAGIVISYVYVKVGRNAYSGENLLKSEVQKAAKDIPFYMIFVVFIGSLLTTFFGGSAGKEGAGVAMGGTFGDFLARKLKLGDGEQRTLVISGVGSAFGVLYDIPFSGALFWILGDNYNGLGQKHINNSFIEPAGILNFIWKILFTAVALGSVFQGGRGNPTFFVGATFGSAIANVFSLPLDSVTALSMVGVFCSATSLPLTSIVMAI